MPLRRRILAAIVTLSLVAIAGYWYFSPYLVIDQMRDAAERRDADAFNARVDYPRVRESLKGQVNAMLVGKVGAAPAKSGESFGALLGMALASPVVDALVTPEMVMRSMREGGIRVLPQVGGDRPADPGADSSAAGGPPRKAWTFERHGFDRLLAYRANSGDDGRSRVAVVFERRGFADWKLTELRILED